MSRLTKAAMMGAAGGAAEGEYIEDLFSTWLYTGNGSTQTITNGIDLAGEGGLVFGGHRNGTSIGNPDRFFYDTERGTGKALYPSSTSGEVTDSNGISAFNSDGFTLPSGNARHNDNGYAYASWTFRKAPGFFDVVTFSTTGDNAASLNVSHSLGSVPGCIIIKRLDSTSHWVAYHRSLNGGTNPEQYRILLSSTAAKSGPTTDYFNSTAPTSTQFTVGTDFTYFTANWVAYVFAHDEAIFGENADQSVIKCGGYTGAGANQQVSLGFEPQWLLIIPSSNGGDRSIYDSMRTTNKLLLAQSSAAESDETNAKALGVLSTGFQLPSTEYGDLNASGRKYIYIAIRRGPMKTPTDATEVFAVDTQNSGSYSSPPYYRGNFVVDAAFRLYRTGGSASYPWLASRLTGGNNMVTSSTAAEVSNASVNAWDYMEGWGGSSASSSTTVIASPMFRRAPGFFDVVTYTGTGSATTVSHNLGAVPSVVLVKGRNSTYSWYWQHYDLGADTFLQLNETGAQAGNGLIFNSTLPTDSVFSLGSLAGTNGSGNTYIAYLFGNVDGISKAGTYTGTGTTLNVDCGFSAGARFVLIKRTDSTGDWYVWDTARGIVSGNDPYLLLNSTAAENTTTDYIDPYSAGFTVTSSAPAALNASGGSYIFLAIA